MCNIKLVGSGACAERVHMLRHVKLGACAEALPHHRPTALEWLSQSQSSLYSYQNEGQNSSKLYYFRLT